MKLYSSAADVTDWPHFASYNGNTFASVIALVIKRLDLDPIQAHVVRSLACHIVAGVSSVEEEESFRRYCESMSG